MKSFFKMVLAVITAMIISVLLIFIIIGGIISSAGSKEDVNVKSNSVLTLKLDKPLRDKESSNPFESFNFSSMSASKDLSVSELIKVLKRASKDERIDGIFLDISAVPSGLAFIEEVREALKDFKSSGKFIYAYSEGYSQPAYYLASVSDKIFLHPKGIAELKGLRSEILFFKGTLEKLGVEPQVFRHGKFKSAIEPFIESSMSASNREQMRTLLFSFWNQMVQGIAEGRNMTPARINEIASGILVRNANDAMAAGLVDSLMYNDEVLELISKKTNNEAIDKINFISAAKYADSKDTESKGGQKDRIAVIFAEGDIVDGEGGNEDIGSATLLKTIRKARLDDKIKAIVLRINSPGGSSLASETIYRELLLAKKAKPLIASMGNYAASGGYYIAAPADTIVAMPNTLTGSIGVFGLFFNAIKMVNKLGVTIDTVKTNPMADIMTSSRAVTAQEREIIQQEVEQIYDDFISIVADNRNISKANVDSLGQGRVWSGTDAKRLGLVDVLGGLDKAIEIAAAKAGIENYRIVNLPAKEDPFEKLIKGLTGDSETRILETALGEAYPYYQKLNRLKKLDAMQMRLPFEIEIY